MTTTLPAEATPVPEIIRRRLAPGAPPPDPLSWLVAGVVTMIAAVVRLTDLSRPEQIIFDEAHYAPNAYAIRRFGVEMQVEQDGATPVDGAPLLGESGAYVVHPPLGKWLIALGDAGFGYTPFGWRIAAALAGIATVLMITRIGRRLFGSTALGAAAGLLVALDGMHVVMSRTAMLDIFLLLFLVAAFGAILLDRDASRRRWLAVAARTPARLAVPWWRFAAAALLGCALAVKWSAVFFLPVFAILVVVWELGARRSAGVRRPVRDGLADESGSLLVAAVIIPVVYLASWTGWFASEHGHRRYDPVDARGESWLSRAYGALRNLYEYHAQAFGFHSGLDTSHPYQSEPWQWLLLARPILFHWSDQDPCGAQSCVSTVLLLGTPLLWWAFAPALVALAWLGIARRDWRALPILLGAAAGIAPWFVFDDRVMFYFYTLPAQPFLVLAVVYVLGALISSGRPGGAETVLGYDRRKVGAVLAGGYLLLVALNFAYFYPLYTGASIPNEVWQARMWLESWV